MRSLGFCRWRAAAKASVDGLATGWGELNRGSATEFFGAGPVLDDNRVYLLGRGRSNDAKERFA